MSELVLGIDTSTRVSVGLARDERVLINRSVGDSRSHIELLATTVKEVIEEAGASLSQLGRIGVGVGPGPFTGLRVGIATAMTLGQALGLPVVGVCSLDVVALQHVANQATGQFVAVLDARRGELYWARYDGSGLRLAGPFVTAPTVIPKLELVGPGLEAYPALAGEPADVCPLDAGYLAASLDRLPAVGLEPLYLRQPDAELPSTRKSTIVGGHLRLPMDGVR